MGNKKRLIGAKVKLVLIDPWDFVTANGQGAFNASILMASQQQNGKDVALLLQVEPPFQFDGVECKYFIASVRHADSSVYDIFSGKAVACNLTRISEARVTSADPFDLSWWRGGIVVIADLSG